MRPLVRVNVSVTVEKDGRRESGFSGAGGRASFDTWITGLRREQSPTRANLQVIESFRLPGGNRDRLPSASAPVLSSFLSALVSRTGPCKYYVNPYAIFLSWR